MVGWLVVPLGMLLVLLGLGIRPGGVGRKRPGFHTFVGDGNGGSDHVGVSALEFHLTTRTDPTAGLLQQVGAAHGVVAHTQTGAGHELVGLLRQERAVRHAIAVAGGHGRPNAAARGTADFPCRAYSRGGFFLLGGSNRLHRRTKAAKRSKNE